MRLEMRDQRGAPGVARRRIAERVELERHPLGDAQLLQQLIGQHEQFDIRRGLGRADDLGVDLMELAEAALLRALVAEHRARGGELERRILLPALGDVGAGDAGSEFGAQRQRIAAAILEGVHLLRDDVAGLAHRAGEHAGRLEDRNLEPLETIEPPDAIERVEHGRETPLLVAENVLGAPDALGGFDTCHFARVSRAMTGKRKPLLRCELILPRRGRGTAKRWGVFSANDTACGEYPSVSLRLPPPPPGED